MHNCYEDILALTTEAPKWWDEEGVPRFCEFDPDECANIYADERVLLLIACQNCGFKFKVARTSSLADRCFDAIKANPNLPAETLRERMAPPLAAAIKAGSIHYGDPPAYFSQSAQSKPGGCCCHAGATMNCLDLKVLEYWRQGDREKGEPWRCRDQSLEIDLPDVNAEPMASVLGRP